MQRDLVEDRRWIARQDHLEGRAFSSLSPGSLAAQLAMYLGWVAGGRVGVTLAGIAFVVPSFLMVLVLAALYVLFGRVAWIQGALYGIGAAVIAIIARSAYKRFRTTLAKDRLLWVLFCGMAIATAWTESGIVCYSCYAVRLPPSSNHRHSDLAPTE
jgi:chromate transporter